MSNEYEGGWVYVNPTAKCYVVVVNRGEEMISPIRHIVDTTPDYNEEKFKAWYYNQYHKIKGDEFHFFLTREGMERFVGIMKEWERGKAGN